MSTLQEVEALVARINTVVDAKNARIARLREFLHEMQRSQTTHGDFDNEDIAMIEEKISEMEKEAKQYAELGKQWMQEVGALHEKSNRRSKVINAHYDILQGKDLTDVREKFVKKQRELMTLLREHTNRLNETLASMDVPLPESHVDFDGDDDMEQEEDEDDDDVDGMYGMYEGGLPWDDVHHGYTNYAGDASMYNPSDNLEN